ncbi:MAG: type II toxin-antitoxin system VapC family toxin [Deltaproteobacteria bacterium]|nr:type II toxin-antitoxin system VapC family toxin [Deltaproteobacteria bacterium]
MITAVDTNILLDVFLPDKKFAPNSAKLLKLAYDEGALIICDIVYAELVPQFEARSLLEGTLETMNVTLVSVDIDVAFLAGEKWSLYRKSGGKRERIISDFLIGAHASVKADRLLTRDRGFYRSYFPEVEIVTL